MVVMVVLNATFGGGLQMYLSQRINHQSNYLVCDFVFVVTGVCDQYPIVLFFEIARFNGPIQCDVLVGSDCLPIIFPIVL